MVVGAVNEDPQLPAAEAGDDAELGTALWAPVPAAAAAWTGARLSG